MRPLSPASSLMTRRIQGWVVILGYPHPEAAPQTMDLSPVNNGEMAR